MWKHTCFHMSPFFKVHERITWQIQVGSSKCCRLSENQTRVAWAIGLGVKAFEWIFCPIQARASSEDATSMKISHWSLPAVLEACLGTSKLVGWRSKTTAVKDVLS